MKKAVLLILILAMSSVMVGCAGAVYARDRKNDLKDVFTGTIGIGGGAKVRVGPFHIGAFRNHDLAGMRAGVIFDEHAKDHMITDMVSPMPVLRKTGLTPQLRTVVDIFRPDVQACPEASLRRKSHVIEGRMPFIAASKAAFAYTQVEIAVGIGPSARVGFNFGELVDFAFGFLGFDIYDDDIGKGRKTVVEVR